MSTVRSSPARSAILLLTCLLGAIPLLSGCMTRSTSVGDRFSGSVIVATSPDNPRGAPKLDVPESMASQITLSDYSAAAAPTTSGAANGQPDSAAPSGDESTTSRAAGATAAGAPTRVGTRAVFSDLTPGQFSQLGDIVVNSFGDSSISMDLTANRSGKVVRFRGSADLGDLAPNRDYVQLTVTFAGPITATEGNQISDNTVSWTPQPGTTSTFSADATYPDPATAAVRSWSWFVAILCLLVVLVVVRLAYVRRDRSPRPGRPRYEDKPGKDKPGTGKPGKDKPGKPSVTADSDRKTDENTTIEKNGADKNADSTS